jgi:hypothetical protein
VDPQSAAAVNALWDFIQIIPILVYPLVFHAALFIAQLVNTKSSAQHMQIQNV